MNGRTAALFYTVLVAVSAFPQQGSTTPSFGLDPRVEGEVEGGPSSVAESEELLARLFLSDALAAVDRGDWFSCLAILNRGRDFSDASSDLAYLRSLAELQCGSPAGAALASIREALAAGRWSRWQGEDGRLLEARILVRLRSFEEALSVSRDLLGSTAASIRLDALRGLGDRTAFRRLAKEASVAYPEDPELARTILLGLSSLAGSSPSSEEQGLASSLIAHLPQLQAILPDIVLAAEPFVSRLDDRMRLVSSYRAQFPADQRSLPIALHLGLIDDDGAVAELFSSDAKGSLDRKILVACRDELRSREGRAAFDGAARKYTGRVVSDEDADGIVESWADYRVGVLSQYWYDADQDGLPELSVTFTDELPSSGEVPLLGGGKLPVFPRSEQERSRIQLRWSRYPFLEEATVKGVRYIASNCSFAPLLLSPLIQGSPTPVLRFPEPDPGAGTLSERSLISFSIQVERRGTLSEDAVERLRLVDGVVRSAEEFASGRLVSRTSYEDGFPLERHLDLDFDGRMETVQRYARGLARPLPLDPLPKPIETDLDADGDGVFEYRERIGEDGHPYAQWDEDGDGSYDVAAPLSKSNH